MIEASQIISRLRKPETMLFGFESMIEYSRAQIVRPSSSIAAVTFTGPFNPAYLVDPYCNGVVISFGALEEDALNTMPVWIRLLLRQNQQGMSESDIVFPWGPGTNAHSSLYLPLYCNVYGCAVHITDASFDTDAYNFSTGLTFV